MGEAVRHRAKKEKFTAESELAKPVVEWLRNEGWDVYQEVQLSSHSSVADIVAYRKPVYWVIECKLRFGIEVIDQARTWKHFAHYTSVAVPYVTERSGSGTLSFLCKHFGIGVLEVNKHQSGSADVSYHRRECASLNRKPPRLADLQSGLREEQKTWAEAGNSFGRRFTPFAATCRGLWQTVCSEPGVSMSDAIKRIKHHYASDQSARSSLLAWAEAGKVHGVRVEREGRSIRLYPADMEAR